MDLFIKLIWDLKEVGSIFLKNQVFYLLCPINNKHAIYLNISRSENKLGEKNSFLFKYGSKDTRRKND
jgi:hypothetical protein